MGSICTGENWVLWCNSDVDRREGEVEGGEKERRKRETMEIGGI